MVFQVQFGMWSLLQRQHDPKCGALVFIAVSSYQAVVLFHDLFGNGQSNARAIIFFPGMQALENGEDLFRVLVIEPDTVIAKDDTAILTFPGGRSIQLAAVYQLRLYPDMRLILLPGNRRPL